MENKIEKIITNINANEKVKSFEVFEDNGGGITLSILGNDGKFYCHTGYEYTIGQLTTDLQALAEGSDPEDWDGMEDMTEEEYNVFVNTPYCGKIIVDSHGFYQEEARIAAKIEFADFIEADEE